MILPPESLAANVARVRPLVRVRSLVDQQIVRLGELPVAELADELFLRPGRSSRRSQQPPVQVLMGQRATRRVEGRRSSWEGAGEHRVTGWRFEKRRRWKQKRPRRQFLPLVRHHGHNLVAGRGFPRGRRLRANVAVRIRRGRRGRRRPG